MLLTRNSYGRASAMDWHKSELTRTGILCNKHTPSPSKSALGLAQALCKSKNTGAHRSILTTREVSVDRRKEGRSACGGIADSGTHRFRNVREAGAGCHLQTR